MTTLPLILLPLGTDDAVLDACLAALEAGTPAGSRVWLADDAQAGPRGLAIVERWLSTTRLRAHYSRRKFRVGESAHLDEALDACGDDDVLVLAPDTVPAPGWAEALVACVERDASIATATPWCNAGETAGWPRIGEISPIPDDLGRLGRACSSLAAVHPELPAAVGHAVLLRGRARRGAGGLDPASYGSWYAALIDLSLRLSGLGWRNALCERAFVARSGEGGPAEGDMDALSARWPDVHARLAGFLMSDPLRASRRQLLQAYTALEGQSPQGALTFPEAAPHAGDVQGSGERPSSSMDTADGPVAQAASTGKAGAP